MELLFVTGNSEKLTIAREALKGSGIILIPQKLNCPEMQSEDAGEIAAGSALFAWKELGPL